MCRTHILLALSRNGKKNEWGDAKIMLEILFYGSATMRVTFGKEMSSAKGNDCALRSLPVDNNTI